MNGLPIEILVILVGIGFVALLFLVMRFWRKLTLLLLVCGILILGLLGALSLAGQSAANYQTAQAATEAAKAAKSASMGTMGALLCIGGLGTLSVSAVGVAGFLYWRLQTEKRLPQQKQRRALPPAAQEPVIWYADNEQDTVDLENIDLSQWGW
ncbi:MAG: hypothetical protein GY832_02445 [Chloroflexi bacterium]|nr:hypothetical protein [Chloroflexota bacterium]